MMRLSWSRDDGARLQSRSATRSTPVPVTPEQTTTGTASPVATSRASERSSSGADGSFPSRYASSWSSSCDTISSVTSTCIRCSSASASAGIGPS